VTHFETHAGGFPKLEPARVAPGRVAALYDRVAGVYDLWARATESRARERALALAAIRDGEDVLEVAAGTGVALERIARANPTGRNVGLDLSEGMLARARAKLAGLPGRHELMTADARALPFPDASFDVILNAYMFDLLPEEDYPRVVAEMRRVLRPGGRLVLVDMALPERRTHGFYQWLSRRRPEWLGGCRGVALTPWLRDAGFEVEQREYLAQLGFPSEVILAGRGRTDPSAG
jgi:demethylmenaquinone methyltransferase/2-methoxy-6-polyprenyl-1,4-benzoquinol methylase